MRHRRLFAVLLAGLLSPALAACGSPFASGDQGFVSGEGNVTIVPAADRRLPDSISGTTLEGDRVSLEDYRGKVVVMPVWGSWCGPCRREAPMLAKAARQLARDGVVFLGIDSRDYSGVETGLAFQRSFGIGYPSIYDPTGALLLNFKAGMSPKTIPSFAFIDRDGRVAATVLGEIDRSTLDGVVEDVQGGAKAGQS